MADKTSLLTMLIFSLWLVMSRSISYNTETNTADSVIVIPMQSK